MVGVDESAVGAGVDIKRKNNEGRHRRSHRRERNKQLGKRCCRCREEGAVTESVREGSVGCRLDVGDALPLPTKSIKNVLWVC